MAPPTDLSGLLRGELEALVVTLFGEVAELKRLVAAQRDEIAHLKGDCCEMGGARPEAQPSPHFNAAISIGYPVLPSGHSTTPPTRPNSLMARGRSKRWDRKSKQIIRSHCDPGDSRPTVKNEGIHETATWN